VTKLIKATTMTGSTINNFATTKLSKGHLTEISRQLTAAGAEHRELGKHNKP